MTIKEVLKEHLSYLRYERNYSPNTISCKRNNIKLFERHLAAALNGKEPELEEVTTARVRAMVRHLSREHQCQSSTIGQFLRDLRVFFDFCVEEGYLDCNVVRRVKIPEADSVPRISLTVDELKKLFYTPDEADRNALRDRVMLKTLYYTGIRAGELAALKVSDVDLEKGILTVRHGKGDKERIIPIHSCLVECLRAYIKTLHPWQEYLFASEWMKPFRNSHIAMIVKKYVRKAGFSKEISPHVLRHTCATHLVKAGVKLNEVSELLGHNDPTTTSYYTHYQLDDLKKLVEKI